MTYDAYAETMYTNVRFWRSNTYYVTYCSNLPTVPCSPCFIGNAYAAAHMHSTVDRMVALAM